MTKIVWSKISLPNETIFTKKLTAFNKDQNLVRKDRNEYDHDFLKVRKTT